MTYVSRMNFRRIVSLLIVLAFLVLPFSAGSVFALTTNTTLPTDTETIVDDGTFINGSNQYGYMTIESVNIVLSGTDAEITVLYDIDPWISFLVFLFGKQDLKKRVLSVVGYPESGKSDQVVTYTYIDNGRASLVVRNAIVDYNDGSYWYPQHSFGTVIPTLTFVIGPSDTKVYNNTKIMQKGFGYFQ